MSFPEILDAVKALPRAEKLQVMQVLSEELTPDEALIARYFRPGVPIAVREPVFAPEAAAVLLELLEAEKRTA